MNNIQRTAFNRCSVQQQIEILKTRHLSNRVPLRDTDNYWRPTIVVRTTIGGHHSEIGKNLDAYNIGDHDFPAMVIILRDNIPRPWPFANAIIPPPTDNLVMELLNSNLFETPQRFLY